MTEAVAEQPEVSDKSSTETLKPTFQVKSIEAYNIDNDQQRHTEIIKIVAPTTSRLAIDSLGDSLLPSSEKELTEIFKKSTADASFAFISDVEENIKPKNYAPFAAIKHKEKVYRLLHPTKEGDLEDSAENEIEQATLRDMFQITKQILEKKGVEVGSFNYNEELVKQIVKYSKEVEGTQNEDYVYTWDFAEKQEQFEEFLRKGEDQDPKEHDLEYLETMVRLANSTWAAGQVHRAREEGKTDRITRDTYLPYDEMIAKQYEKFSSEDEVSKEQAFAYVSYIVFKDIYELQKAQNQTKN